MSDNATTSHSDTMTDRVDGGHLQTWILMKADRRLLAAALLLLMLAGLLAAGSIDPPALRRIMSNSDPAETLFQALVGAIITGVTLVVTISQLVLSQELGALSDQNDRMEGAMAFRRAVEEKLGVPASPPEPSAFLRALVEQAGTCARSLTDAAEDAASGSTQRQVYNFAQDLTENAQLVSQQLDGAHFGTFDVVSASLNFNYSWKIYEARRLMKEEALPDDIRATLNELVEVLTLFGPAREHIKTLYFEWELTDLSRWMIYLAVPALVVSITSLLYLEVPPISATTFLGIERPVWLVSLAVSISVSPFLLLLAYILRLVTVANRTLAMGPFILRTTDRTRDIGEEA